MNVTYEMVVDFARPYKNHKIMVVQDDHLSRICHFILRSNGKALGVGDVVNYTLTAVKPDETTVHDTGTLDVDDEGIKLNEITYEIPQELTDVIGTCTCSIALTSESGAVLHSFEFYIKPRNELRQEEDDTEDDLAGFRDILNRAAEAIEKIETLSNKSRLPDPYPLRLVVGDKTYTFDGNETVTVQFTGLVYLSESKNKETTPLTWTS